MSVTILQRQVLRNVLINFPCFDDMTRPILKTHWTARQVGGPCANPGVTCSAPGSALHDPKATANRSGKVNTPLSRVKDGIQKDKSNERAWTIEYDNVLTSNTYDLCPRRQKLVCAPQVWVRCPQGKQSRYQSYPQKITYHEYLYLESRPRLRNSVVFSPMETCQKMDLYQYHTGNPPLILHIQEACQMLPCVFPH